mmetsp:Transcript_4711/g.7141  ORF Transcript_4711/g.7141 Transcript_4711/m.7141 type:complete len:213 (-) Transcript_4711:120-758(-)
MTANETDSKGIPIKGPYGDGISVALMYTMMNVVFSSVFGTLSYYLIVKGNEAAVPKLSLLAEYDLGYIYLAAIILNISQLAMGINVGNARKHCKVHNPDQHIYQVKGAEGSKLGYVLMDNEGVNGKFNRAQRAAANFNESYAQNIFYILLAGFVYPKEVMIISSVMGVGRVVMALGYTGTLNGRLGGFMISKFAAHSLECLVGITAYKVLNM